MGNTVSLQCAFPGRPPIAFGGNGAAVTASESFGPTGAGKVRLSFATADGLLKEGLARIASFAKGGSGVRGRGAGT